MQARSHEQNCCFLRVTELDALIHISETNAFVGSLLMPRMIGLERSEAPWHLRWFYGMMRKMFGKDLTPAKIQMRVPGIVWGAVGMEMALGRKRRLSLRYTQLGKIRTAARIGCPF